MSNEKTVLELILDEIKELRKEMNNMNVIQGQQHITLQDHTRRSETLEKLYEMLREELQPVKTHVAQIEGALKFLGGMAVLVGMIAGLMQIVSSFF